MAERPDRPSGLVLAWIEDGRAQQQTLEAPSAGPVTYRALLDSQPVRALIRRLGWTDWRWSVFGARRDLDEPVSDGDRLELLPPLLVDPKVARQRRVEHRRRLTVRSKWLPDRRL